MNEKKISVGRALPHSGLTCSNQITWSTVDFRILVEIAKKTRLNKYPWRLLAIRAGIGTILNHTRKCPHLLNGVGLFTYNIT